MTPGKTLKDAFGEGGKKIVESSKKWISILF